MESGVIRTTCPYCGVGCGLKVAADGTLSGDKEHPANYGRLCSKGAALGDTLATAGRLLAPQIGGRNASWDEALDRIATTFKATVAEHGPDAVALYVSGQFLTEDYYVANKLMKGFIGSANIDTNSRLCMASSVAGHSRAFGADIVPGCYDDIEAADLVVLVGSNTAWCHPVLYQRLVAAREKRGTKVVAIDPRHTSTCDIADIHLALRPGTDVAVFAGLLVHLAERGVCDAAWTEKFASGFAAALDTARKSAPSLAAVASIADVPAADLARFYDCFAATERSVTFYSQGTNQSSSGTDKVNAIVNCHLATGRIGRPGMGPFSLTGQPNAMGGREVGGLANQLAAHMSFADPADIDRVRRFWNAPRIADTTRPQGGRAVRGRARRQDQGAVDSQHQSGRQHAARRAGARRARRLPVRRRQRLLADRYDGVCRYRAAGRRLGREGRHRHQFGTLHFPPARLSAAAGRSPAGLVDDGRGGAAHGLGGGLSPIAARPRFSASTPRCRVSRTTAPRRRIFDIGALADLSDDAYDRLPPVRWPLPRETSGSLTVESRSMPSGCSATARLSDAGWPCALRADAVSAAGGRRRRPMAAHSQYRTPARPVAHHDAHWESAAADGASARARARHSSRRRRAA